MNKRKSVSPAKAARALAVLQAALSEEREARRSFDGLSKGATPTTSPVGAALSHENTTPQPRDCCCVM